jgi:hypothetical protein
MPTELMSLSTAFGQGLRIARSFLDVITREYTVEEVRTESIRDLKTILKLILPK